MGKLVVQQDSREVSSMEELGLPGFNPLASVERPSLPRITISRDTCQYIVAGNPYRAFTGHILAVENVRAWWRVKYGEGPTGAPQCYAIGKLTPDIQCELPQAENCLSCTHQKFSPAFSDTELACHQKKRFLVLVDGDLIPSILDVPALGLKACDRWLTAIAARADVGPVLPLWQIRFGLQPRASKTSDYSATEPTFELLERSTDLIPDLVAAVKAFGARAKEEEIGGDD